MKIAQSIVRRFGSSRSCSLSRRSITTSIGSSGRTGRSVVAASRHVGNSVVVPVKFVDRRFLSSESKSLLLDILAKEEQEEIDSGNMGMPSELKDLKAIVEQDWRIVEDGATTSLFRKEHSHKVHVSFHCQDTVEDFLVDEEDADDDEEEPSSPVRFTATVTKAGKSLVFACFSEYGTCKIEGISTTSVAAETVHDNQGTLSKPEYQGPDFIELAEELQDQLLVYLDEDCGVNSDVAAFISMFSDYREEACYLNWLKETQNIVS